MPLDCEVTEYVANQVSDYVKRSDYKAVIFLHDPENWGNTVKHQCQSACKKKGTVFRYLTVRCAVNQRVFSNFG